MLPHTLKAFYGPLKCRWYRGRFAVGNGSGKAWIALLDYNTGRQMINGVSGTGCIYSYFVSLFRGAYGNFHI